MDSGEKYCFRQIKSPTINHILIARVNFHSASKHSIEVSGNFQKMSRIQFPPTGYLRVWVHQCVQQQHQHDYIDAKATAISTVGKIRRKEVSKKISTTHTYTNHIPFQPFERLLSKINSKSQIALYNSTCEQRSHIFFQDFPLVWWNQFQAFLQ